MAALTTKIKILTVPVIEMKQFVRVVCETAKLMFSVTSDQEGNYFGMISSNIHGTLLGFGNFGFSC